MVDAIPAGAGADLASLLLQWRTQINSNCAPGWTTFTPTWTAATSNPVLGNGSLTGKYRRSANSDIVHFWIKLLIGSTTTFGSGVYRFGIGAAPALSASSKLWCSPVGWVRDASTTANYGIVARWDSALNVFIPSEQGSLMTPTTPVALANTDEMALQGWYEPA
jgi:hypothetical protein